MERLKSIWTAVRLPLCNTFIVVVLALILLDALPFGPPLLREKIAPLLTAVGLRQGEWSMFAPLPDNYNERLSAEIEYDDGTIVQWSSPDWRAESVAKRFAQSRRQEYLDNVTMLTTAGAWPGLADFVARTHAADRPNAALRRVTLFKESADIPDAADRPWPSMGQVPEYGERSQFYERYYP